MVLHQYLVNNYSAGGGGGSNQISFVYVNTGLMVDQEEVVEANNPATPNPGGTGNTPPVSPPQGSNGGGCFIYFYISSWRRWRWSKCSRWK
jgi:hypothetical protein